MQEAVAAGLEQAAKRHFVEIQCAEYLERRKVLADAFDKLGMRYTLPEGTYFLLLVSLSLCARREVSFLTQAMIGYLRPSMA